MRNFGVGWLVVSGLVLVIFSSAPASALTVPDNECLSLGCTWSAIYDPELDCTWVTDDCIRTDSDVIVVEEGTPDIEIGQDLICNNCSCTCPDDPPPPMNCTGTLSVSYGESINSSVAAGIEVGVPGIKATLESSIGHENERQKQFSLTCGSTQFPACKKGKYQIELGVTEDIQKKVTHSYGWIITDEGEDCTPPLVWGYGCSLTRTSTATGDCWGSASCAWKGYLSCD